MTPLDISPPAARSIVASACSEGFGSPEFRAAQRALWRSARNAFLAHPDREIACRHR